MSIAFKEWALVCDALGAGTQSIILRKGGIAEGREGFRFQHADFFLFPTLFHEQLAKTRLPPGTALPVALDGRIRITHKARVEWTLKVERLEMLGKLLPFHILKPEVVEERFRYDDTPGVHLAFLRVFALSAPWEFPDAPAYGGCRSWVKLPEIPGEITFAPILTNEAHAALGEKIRRQLSEA